MHDLKLRPRLVFVCTDNSAFGQMAEAFMRRHSLDFAEAYSAGLKPASALSPLAIEVMHERGIDISGQRISGLGTLPTDRLEAEPLQFIPIDCALPAAPPRRVKMRWSLPASGGDPIGDMRAARDKIEHDVFTLLSSYGVYKFDSTSSWESLRGTVESHYRHGPYPLYMDEVLPAALLNIVEVPPGTTMYRARALQPSPRSKGINPYPPDEMWEPPAEYASGGRLNPPGIPYLYLAEDERTAVSEVKVTKGVHVTVGVFVTKLPLRLLDLASPHPRGPYKGNAVRRLNEIFSESVHPESQRRYGASQSFAEILKAETRKAEVHGIRYSSALELNGVNVALFGGHRGANFKSMVACTEVRFRKVVSVAVETVPATPSGP